MLLQKEDPPPGSRSIAFLAGSVLALALFAVFAWDLGHHRTPYSPGSPPAPPSPWSRFARGLGGAYLLFHTAYSALLLRRKRQSKAAAGYWPKRNTGPAPPASDNAGATQAHPSESASADPRR